MARGGHLCAGSEQSGAGCRCSQGSTLHPDPCTACRHTPGFVTSEEGVDREFWVSFHNLALREKLRDLKTAKIGRLVAFEGTVTRASEVRCEGLATCASWLAPVPGGPGQPTLRDTCAASPPHVAVPAPSEQRCTGGLAASTASACCAGPPGAVPGHL